MLCSTCHESSNQETGSHRFQPKTHNPEARQPNPVWHRIATRIQPRLSVSVPGDPEELEADQIADRVMRTSDRALQRKCAACEEEEDASRVQRKDNEIAAPSPPGVPPIVHEALSGTGRPLDPATKEFFEPRFGHDFSSVRVHSGPAAEQSARSVNAHAFTVGRDIVFASGQYAPGSDSGRLLLAHELVHTIQQGSQARTLARQPSKKGGGAAPAPAPAPCTMSCTDPAFLALSASAREAQLNTQCPQGFPSTGNTFFTQPIPSVSKTLLSKLLDAQSRAKKAMCLSGQDPNGFVLDRPIITYATHSPAMDKAVDIDVKGQPYIMHEKGEGNIDKDVGEVYDRIAFWSYYRKSIIPQGITSVARPKGGTGTQRTWTNPSTGKQEPITTGELYDLLKSESTGMQGYFNLLLKSDRDLQIAVDAFLVFNDAPLANITKLKLPTDESMPSVLAFRQRIADDYRLLGGSKAQLDAFAGTTIGAASKAPPARTGDRPFEGGVPAGTTLKSGAPDPAQVRRPELGFLILPREVVVALTEVGLVWGAIDFGGESGDVMHFDCRAIPGC